MKSPHIPILVAALLAVVGCAPLPSGTPNPTPTPTATVQEATPQQIASIIAGNEVAWRAAAASAAECRMLWILSDKLNGLQHVRAMQCYTDERKAVRTARVAYLQMQALVVPVSMRSLVEETTEALRPLAGADLDNATCGYGAIPNDSESCTAAMRETFAAYKDLPAVLDAWKPYI